MDLTIVLLDHIMFMVLTKTYGIDIEMFLVFGCTT